MTSQQVALDWDGERITGSTYVELVRRLWDTAMLREPSKAVYMRAVARRVKLWSGDEIRDRPARAFLSDLEVAGYIRLEGQVNTKEVLDVRDLGRGAEASSEPGDSGEVRAEQP